MSKKGLIVTKMNGLLYLAILCEFYAYKSILICRVIYIRRMPNTIFVTFDVNIKPCNGTRYKIRVVFLSLLIIGGTVEIVQNEEGNLRGIFFQDDDMKSTFSSYPEILFIDATYKLNELRLPLYVLLIEDGNGLSEIVAIWLIADESGTTIQSMADLLIKHNPCTRNVKVVMADKDFNEREVYANAFPQASLLICDRI